MVNCRNATRSDMKAIADMYTNYQELGCDTPLHQKVGTGEYEQMFNKLIETGSIILVEDTETGTVVGYAICRAYDDGVCNLGDIYIEPKFRHKGYGRKCIEFICDEAKSLGMEWISAASITLEQDAFLSRIGFSSKNFGDEYLRPLN